MSTNRPSSETMAVAALTIVSLVGGLAVACTAGAGAGPPPVRAKALPAVPAARSVTTIAFMIIFSSVILTRLPLSPMDRDRSGRCC